MSKIIYLARDGEINGNNDGNLSAYKTVPVWSADGSHFKFSDWFMDIHGDCENCTDTSLFYSNNNGQLNFPEIKNGDVFEAEISLVKKV